MPSLSDFSVLDSYAGLWLAAGTGSILAAVCVTYFRRHQRASIEHDWFVRRVSVPRRPDFLDFADRRKHPRRTGNPVTVVLMSDDETTRLGEGRVVDRSVSGVGLATTTRLPVGARLRITPFGRPTD